ncbi:N-6 DNA methylase [Photobacterium damselae]|uniref:N-6 DNA methylase n=1 Tax=Photobacterium damselae TaxID=38293 RepID=UPI000B051742|nr:N-6 DNA methylase [Photobacterium damselae]
MNPHSLAKKRELGAYYTPPELSQVLADWAIRYTKENILEPSFGGCGFFTSSIERLRELGCTNPEDKLFGVDIDKHAFDILNRTFEKDIKTEDRFIKQDFIQVKPEDFSVGKFDVVLGNPPYVSMHNMTQEQRQSCDKVLRNSPFLSSSMGRNASLWAFFLLHSLEFIKEGGRIAWVLPSSLLHADYAAKLIEIHQKHFSKIKVLKLAERFFKEEGAQETSIILLAEDFHHKAVHPTHISIDVVDNIVDLKNIISKNSCELSENLKDYKINIVSSSAKLAYRTILQQEYVKNFGEYADIKIGMVTGANKYFVINQSIADEYGLSDDILHPIVGRFSYLKGIGFNKKKISKLPY